MKTFLEFINEKLSSDEIIDLYQYFIRILKLHEQHYYNEIRIATNKEFKEELDSIFKKIQDESKSEAYTNLFGLVLDYESNLYKNDLIQGDGFSSISDVCEAVAYATPENIDYLKNFSEKDIHKQSKEEYDKSVAELDSEIKDLEKQEKGLSKINDILSEVWENAIEEEGDDVDKVLMFVINKLLDYKKQYPELAEELQNEIDDILDNTMNKEDFE